MNRGWPTFFVYSDQSGKDGSGKLHGFGKKIGPSSEIRS